MKKVCHMSSVHGRNDVRIFLKECCSLARAGYEVIFLCADNQPDEVINNVRIRSTIFKPRNRIARIIGAKKVMFQGALSINADIYHFHDPELLSVGLALKKRDKKVIYDSHEDVPRQILSKPWIPKLLRKTISWIFENYENYIVKRLDHIVTATPHIEGRFDRICGSGRTTTINNFPMMSEFTNPIPWSSKRPECCYIGGITKIRGICQLVEAMGLTKIKLNLCGEFESTELREIVYGLPGFKYVTYYGFLERSDLNKVLNDSKIGIVTFLPVSNHIYAQPNKMFEYMAASIPVIASGFPLWKSIVEENECGICVDPFDSKAISETILLLLRNDEKAKRMGENGRQAVEKKYNWSLEEEKLLKLYKEI